MADKPKSKKLSDWVLEIPFDLAATLDELIKSPPFKEASDEHGDSMTAGSRIPMWLHRRVVKLRELPGSPYELNSDVLRDALYLGMQILGMRYKTSPDWNVETKMAAVVDASGASRRVKSQFDSLTVGLEELCRDGDERKAAERLSEYVLAANELDDEWHKEKVFRFLEDSSVVRDVLGYCPGNIQKLVRRPRKRKKNER